MGENENDFFYGIIPFDLKKMRILKKEKYKMQQDNEVSSEEKKSLTSLQFFLSFFFNSF